MSTPIGNQPVDMQDFFENTENTHTWIAKLRSIDSRPYSVTNISKVTHYKNLLLAYVNAVLSRLRIK